MFSFGGKERVLRGDSLLRHAIFSSHSSVKETLGQLIEIPWTNFRTYFSLSSYRPLTGGGEKCVAYHSLGIGSGLE